jgi:hypothetical protein
MRGKHECRATALHRTRPQRFLAAFRAIKRNGWACGREFESHAGARGSAFGISPRVACRLQAHLAAASAVDADDDFGTRRQGEIQRPRAGSANPRGLFCRPDQGAPLGAGTSPSPSMDSASWQLLATCTHESLSLLKNRRVSSSCAAWARSAHMAARLQASSVLDMTLPWAFFGAYKERPPNWFHREGCRELLPVGFSPR